MRLHTLTLTAFGPFPGTEHIDFDSLSQDGLFLLHGRTGSGKTFVLDAITFALYGEVTGQRGRNSRLRSDHAPAQRRPEVVLEFTQSARRYRVTRSPQHMRPKQRGTGTIQENQRVHLEVSESGGWRAAASGVQAVGKELQEILPLDRPQFTKVILLPQGDFAEFLRASSKDKQELLERLFETERFSLLQQRLRDEARAAAEEVREVGRSIEVQHAAVQDAAVQLLGEGWEAPGHVEDTTQDSEVPERKAAEAAVAAGERRREELVEELSGLAERRRAAEAEAETLSRRHTALLRWAEHHQRTEEHERRLPEVEEARDALERHHQAEGLRSWFRASAEAQRRACQLGTAAEEAVAQARQAVAGQQDIAAAALLGSTREETAAEAAVAEALRELTELQGRLAAEDAAALEREQQELTTRGCRLAAEQEQRRQQEAEETKRAEELAAEIAALRADLLDPEELEARREQLQAKRHELTQRSRRIDEARRLCTEHTEVAEGLTEAERSAQQAAQEHQQLLRQHLRGVAHRLAGELQEGQPCLVCGSPEHPDPARPDERTVTEEEVEEALERNRAASERRAGVQARKQSLLSRLTVTAAELGEEDQQGPLPSVTSPDYADQLARMRRETEDSRQQTEEQLGTLEDRRAAYRLTIARLEETDRRRTEAEKALAEHRHRLQMIEVEQARAADDSERAERALRGLRGAHRSVRERLETLERTEQALIAARDALSRTAAGKDQARQAQQEAADRLEESRFGSQAESEGALLQDPVFTELGEQVRGWDSAAERLRVEAEQEDVVEGRLRAEQGETLPSQEQVSSAEEHAAACAQEQETTRRILERFTDRLTTLRDHTVRLEAHLQTRESQRADQQRRTELAATVNGEGPDNIRRMTLTTFVLAARLERVAQAATRHLQIMSEGRYRLLHDDDPSGRGLRGLDLKVHDEHSDEERPTSSLSGGETFMAALAMALGLAEVVQADAGGVGLESLFIDEGFGSLDEETLEHVMAALTRLQGEGRRVGVVSHVTEMHRAIPVQLRIRRGSRGSFTTMVLPSGQVGGARETDEDTLGILVHAGHEDSVP